MTATPTIRAQNQAEQRKANAITNVMERLDAIEAMHDGTETARRRQAEQIVAAVLALTQEPPREVITGLRGVVIGAINLHRLAERMRREEGVQ